MITKPSIGEITTGMVRNFESLLSGDGEQVLTLLVPALAVLDRLDSEWPSWIALLQEDNEDLRTTLQSLGAESVPAASAITELAGAAAAATVEALEAENRQLKLSLVALMEALDLPAGADATEAVRDADAQVLALLRRMLHREHRVPVPDARSAATGGNPASGMVPLDELREVLLQFLAARMPDAVTIDIQQLQPLAGGASREAWVFDVAWQDAHGQHAEPCILMREPVASVLVSDSAPERIDGTRRTVQTEISVVRAMERAGFPVPTVLWEDASGSWLERPFSIARRLPGTADVAELVSREHPQPILHQYLELLVQLHALDPHEAGVDFLGDPGDCAAIAQVEQFEQNFEHQRLEAFPATTYLIRWLKKHAPRNERLSIVHGDYRLGNFLYDKDEIIAVLDWEQVHLGDPAEEIAFMYWDVWSLEPIWPIESFVEQYEQVSGHRIGHEKLAYYRMFIEFKMLVVLFTGLKAFYATPESQLHYASAQTTEMIRASQLRAIEALCQGGPSVAFDAYQKTLQGGEHG